MTEAIKFPAHIAAYKNTVPTSVCPYKVGLKKWTMDNNKCWEDTKMFTWEERNAAQINNMFLYRLGLEHFIKQNKLKTLLTK